MCIASIYLAMLITNWNSYSPTTTTTELRASNFGFWVRVVMSWLTALLYIWTLLAPRVFPDRDFTVTWFYSVNIRINSQISSWWVAVSWNPSAYRSFLFSSGLDFLTLPLFSVLPSSWCPEMLQLFCSWRSILRCWLLALILRMLPFWFTAECPFRWRDLGHFRAL